MRVQTSAIGGSAIRCLYNRCFKSLIVLKAFLFFALPGNLYAQKDSLPDGTNGVYFNSRKADAEFAQDKKDLPLNEFVGTAAMFRVGLAYMGDFTAYSQTNVFKQQMDSADLTLKPNFQTRDFRVLFSGRFLKTKRYIAYRFAYMYDGNEKVWVMRESGLTIGVPELKGHIFVGRTKEGFSMIKTMNGHSGVGYERQMALDPVPILADGIKYFGYFPKSRIFMNLGYFNDILSKGHSFSTFSWQTVGRVGWMPFNQTEKESMLHIAVNFRYGKPLDGKFNIKSRPESNPTPQLINTGVFSADKSSSVGGEIYYSNKRFMIGSEIMQHNFYSNSSEDHHFYGGDAIISYIFTGSSHPYNTVGNLFGFVPVKKSVFKGGIGEIEGVVHISTFNLNNGSIKGGQITRLTPMINWYLSKVLRWEFIYGYGVLDRYNLKGGIHFFESRVQVSLL